MGTSHRHSATVAGEPNWGNASSAVTGIARAEEKLDELDNELEGEEEPGKDIWQDEDEQREPATVTDPAKIARRQRQLDNQIRRNYHKAVRYLVKASGGRSNVSSGASRAIGHAGVSIASNFISTVSEILKNGLSDWLGRRGVASLEGKSCQDVIDLIRNYIGEGVAGMDTTAANAALEFVLDELGQMIGEDLSDFEKAMNAIMASDDIKNLLDNFFGMYIFSHLSQNFIEKLEYGKGTRVANETMNEIKELIIDDIQRNLSGGDASKIDWSTAEGETFIQAEFDRILYILSGNED